MQAKHTVRMFLGLAEKASPYSMGCRFTVKFLFFNRTKSYIFFFCYKKKKKSIFLHQKISFCDITKFEFCDIIKSIF